MKGKQGLKSNGLLMGHIELFTESYPNADHGTIKIKQYLVTA